MLGVVAALALTSALVAYALVSPGSLHFFCKARGCELRFVLCGKTYKTFTLRGKLPRVRKRVRLAHVPGRGLYYQALAVPYAYEYPLAVEVFEEGTGEVQPVLLLHRVEGLTGGDECVEVVYGVECVDELTVRAAEVARRLPGKENWVFRARFRHA